MIQQKPVGEGQLTPENTTHPKTQILGTVDFLYFRMCFVLLGTNHLGMNACLAQEKRKRERERPRETSRENTSARSQKGRELGGGRAQPESLLLACLPDRA